MEYENGLALRVCVETGLRIGDALKIKGEDIDGRTLNFIAEKTGKKGRKELSSQLARELKRLSTKPTSYIFRGRGKSGHRTRQAVYIDLKKACERLGVEGQISPHSARKSYAVEIFHNNGLNAVQKELQHRNVSDTFLYCLSDMFVPKNSKTKKEDTETVSPSLCPLLTPETLQQLAEAVAASVVEMLKIDNP